MLRDDAIRAGLIKPTIEDRKRMDLAPELELENKEDAFDTADESEGIEAVIDLNDLTYNELRKKAKDLGIDVPRGCKKAELIKLIEENL